jgi:Ca2+-binding EF-hand superfamily protein
LAALEAEAMLLGIWKSFAELEDTISLEELEQIVSAGREREHRHNKFMAALKGVDIDSDGESDMQERFASVQRNADAILSGRDIEEVELEDLGIDIEKE